MAAARRSCAAAGRSAAEGRPGEGTAGAGACGAPRCSHGAEGAEWGAGSTPRARGVGRARRAARLERDPFRLQARVSSWEVAASPSRGASMRGSARRAVRLGEHLSASSPRSAAAGREGASRGGTPGTLSVPAGGGPQVAGVLCPFGTPRSAAARACPPPCGWHVGVSIGRRAARLVVRCIAL